MLNEGDKKELCVLHIGMPKTGSSTLQEYFHNGIEDQRVSYANIPEPNHGPAIFGLYTKEPLKYHYFSHRSWNLEDIKKFNEKRKELLIEGFLDKTSSIEIISAEDLFHLHEEGVEELNKFLEKYFKKIIVVAYVRPVKSFCESAFQQLVKYHEVGSFDFSIIYHNYKNFKRYDNVFGKENVYLWIYDKSIFPEGDIVLDFTRRLNLKSAVVEKKTVNKSLSKEAISILFTYHHYSSLKTDFKNLEHSIINKFVDILYGFGDEKFNFSGKLIEKIINENLNDYSWIVDRMGCPLYEEGETDTGAIQCEEELLNYSVRHIDFLLSLIGEDQNVKFKLNREPKSVALLVDMILERLAEEISDKKHKKHDCKIKNNKIKSLFFLRVLDLFKKYISNQ